VESHEMRSLMLTSLSRHDVFGEDLITKCPGHGGDASVRLGRASVSIVCESDWMEVVMISKKDAASLLDKKAVV
jgi:hypothetical protein